MHRSNIFSRKVGCFNNLTVRSTQDKLVSVQDKSTLRVKMTIFSVKLCPRISRLHFGIQLIFFKVTKAETLSSVSTNDTKVSPFTKNGKNVQVV